MQTPFPNRLYSAEQSRQLDRIAIEQCCISGITLMKRAGRAAWQQLLGRWPEPETITVFCGGGNNGGDGYIVAALAAEQHIPVILYYLSAPEKLQGDAALARDFAAQAGVEFKLYKSGSAIKGVIVDALLGTGSKGAPRPSYAEAIAAINKSQCPALAIDIPSGLSADTGAAERAVQAELTVTFIGVKQGLVTGRGPALCGDLVLADLDVSEIAYQQVDSNKYCLKYHALPARRADAHKGDFGHVLIVGGESGMGGAVAMAAEAAAHCGAGLVSVVTKPENTHAILARRPEVMAKGISEESTNTIDSLLRRASVIVIGPGLGSTAWSNTLLEQVLASPSPKVVDADALNLLSTDVLKKHRDDNWVLTPHPGEAARLLGLSNADIQNDRYQAVAAIQKQRGGVAILKGAGSLVADEDGVGVCRAGNPGMATGGMGDVLSGVIGALLSQGLSLEQAAECGVQYHAMAGDRAARAGQRGLLATDLMPHLRRIVNGLV